jgi:beta propeller repeat protein
MSAAISSRTRRAAAFLAPAAVAVAAVLLPAAVPAPASAAPAIFPVCIQAGGQAGPDVAGDLAVWTDDRNGNLDIYGRYLSSRTDFAVCANPAGQDNPSVTKTVIGGATHYVVVWADDRNPSPTGGTDIRGRDVTTKTNFAVSTSATLKWYPEICDSWVVWVEADKTEGPYRIMARDLDAKTDKTYRVAMSTVLSPLGVSRRVVGGKTVHTAVYTSASGDISGRDLEGLPNDSTPFAVAQTSKFEWSPDISGNRVVWWETGGRVMVRDLRKKKTTFVALGARPRIDGALVVWDGGGYGGTFTITYAKNAAIYVRNLSKNAPTVKIAQKDQTCLFPAVSGTTVVWESGPARRVLSHIHIYGARL